MPSRARPRSRGEGESKKNKRKGRAKVEKNRFASRHSQYFAGDIAVSTWLRLSELLLLLAFTAGHCGGIASTDVCI